ncbi:MAG: pyruvate formate lyase family protein, partial [Clostridia bacterium]
MSAMDSKDSPVNPLLSRFEKPLCDISSTLDPADWSYLQDKFQCPTFAPDSGMPFSDLKREVAQLAEKWKDLPRPCVKARCFAYVCEHVQLAVSPHDWFVGLGCWNRYDKPLSAVISRWMDEVFSQKLADASTLIDQHNRAGTLAMWMDYDHSVPDWDAVLSLGFEGLRKRALSYREQRRARSEMTPEAEAYFEAIEIQYTAVHQLLSRLIAYAETHNDGSARMRRVLHALRHLQFHPPTDTLEALELIDLYFMLSEHIDCLQVRSLGNLDRTLFPFYQRDLETGRYSEGEIRQLYSHFMMQFASINNYWGHPFYLGGTDEHGASTFNALSSLILEEFEKLDVTSPKL